MGVLTEQEMTNFVSHDTTQDAGLVRPGVLGVQPPHGVEENIGIPSITVGSKESYSDCGIGQH